MEARESQLLAQVSAMQAENQVLHEQLAVAHKRIEELEKQKTPPPAFVKANVVKPQAEEKQRKKREQWWSSIASSTVRCARMPWEGSAWLVGAR